MDEASSEACSEVPVPKVTTEEAKPALVPCEAYPEDVATCMATPTSAPDGTSEHSHDKGVPEGPANAECEIGLVRVGDDVHDLISDTRGVVVELSATGADALVDFKESDSGAITVAVAQLWVIGRDGLRVGQRVTWRGADDDLPRGSVGILQAFRENGSISVRFGQCRFGFPARELLDGWSSGEIQPGDRVRWRDSDDDIPVGSVGVVLGFHVTTGATLVEFDERICGFTTDQLEVTERCTVENHVSDGDVDVERPVAEIDSPRRPCYPFDGKHIIEFDGDKHVLVALTEGQGQPLGVVVYCPGIHGGVGPCRTPGTNHDPNALFPTTARRLKANGVYSCRVCWSAMMPDFHEAVHGTVLATHHVLRQLRERERNLSSKKALQKKRRFPKQIGVCLVGHSLGGAVVLAAARMLAKILPELNDRDRARGIDAAPAKLVGVCTLAAQERGAVEAVRELGSDVQKLFLHGSEDQVLSCQAAVNVHEAAMMPKEIEILEGGEHDFYTYKQHVLGRVRNFILQSLHSELDVRGWPPRRAQHQHRQLQWHQHDYRPWQDWEQLHHEWWRPKAWPRRRWVLRGEGYAESKWSYGRPPKQLRRLQQYWQRPRMEQQQNWWWGWQPRPKERLVWRAKN